MRLQPCWSLNRGVFALFENASYFLRAFLSTFCYAFTGHLDANKKLKNILT